MDSCLFCFVVYILQQYQKYMKTNRNFKGILIPFLDVDINDWACSFVVQMVTKSHETYFYKTDLKHL